MTKPTFQEIRKHHGITLNMLIEDAQVDLSAVLLLDTWNIGEAGIALATLGHRVSSRFAEALGASPFRWTLPTRWSPQWWQR